MHRVEPPPTAERIESRRLLLDALAALAPIAPAVVLGGGQAVDLQVPASTLPVQLSTRDGDLTLDVRALTGPSPVGAMLAAAGLRITGGHGHWARAASRLRLFLARRWPVRVDVMVPGGDWPVAVAGPDPRASGDASDMPPMVVTLLDDAPRVVGALDPADPRRPTVRVAGLASLLLTKLHKFETRRLRAEARGARAAPIHDKDVLDVVRIVLAAPPTLATDLARLRDDPRGAAVARTSLSVLRTCFGALDALGGRQAHAVLAAAGVPRLAEDA
ncbi:MAG: hypothetical protein JNM10_20265, partial [Planctomycetia bacterium]|nr:hypothetical protein [Planctomycetia bacterium]